MSLVLLMIARMLALPDAHGCVHTASSPAVDRGSRSSTGQRVIARTTERLGVSPHVKKLLRLVARRESDYEPGLVHRLGPDLEASRKAYRRTRRLYPGTRHVDPVNWQTYGLFGMNSNYFTRLWGVKADPRVLCDPVVDVVVYLRAADRTLQKMPTISCPTATGRIKVHVEPTIYNVHRAVSSGKLCPDDDEREARRRSRFVRRARRYNLDPDATVTRDDLGAIEKVDLADLWGYVARVK